MSGNETGQAQVSDRVLTVPNLLSFSRLLLVPVFLAFLVQGQDAAALIVLVISSVSDFLDGYIARRFNQMSRLGQLLDPAADRLYIFAAIIGLAWRDLVPWWIVGLIVGRDVFLLVLGVILANYGYGPLPVHQLGKVATFALFLGLPLIMLGLALPAIAVFSQPIAWAVTLWGAFLYWWAGAIYLIETVRAIRLPRASLPRQSDTLEP
ncbi:CDP-alcohol phosphatidyltransferase family protein [Microterricola pindariensis]|uniref:CDP-diacylglycerol--glycerol-3-phosphate 3-phosphatidyltransferase n=1 Tax=Microterricola pindariensis TaxID=478010 RepID=A0ABX5AVP7_9MICO|nr:CDP-alcohol phosphatidyltransferase family protein [Microterricola pindariensis]PPL18599.1 CDP-diacylglycerol--glycerol-3-phosphate 3-phosphatidyltransferase [Microterricola pindariensis]